MLKMSHNTHWFVVWVPSMKQERKERSRSRTASFVRDLSASLKENDMSKCEVGEVKENVSPKAERPFVVTTISEDKLILEVHAYFDLSNM